jgi:hypothetical protein
MVALAQCHEVEPIESLGVVLVVEGLDVVDLLCWGVLALLLAAVAPGVVLQEEPPQLAPVPVVSSLCG